jgi:hypothetical protein
MNRVLDSMASRLWIVLAIATMQIGSARADFLWQNPVTISGDSDVSLLGASVTAWSARAALPTGSSVPVVNGVSFGSTPSTIPTGFVLDSVFGDNSSVISGLSSSYRSMLSAGAFNGNTGLMTISLSGLTAGNSYLFQAWSNDARNNTNPAQRGRSTLFDSGVGTPQSAPVLQPFASGSANIGQYVIGTFTANGSTQSVRLTGVAQAGFGVPLINAYQLRDITAVPEPSSLLLLASISGVGFVFMRRARRRAN